MTDSNHQPEKPPVSITVLDRTLRTDRLVSPETSEVNWADTTLSNLVTHDLHGVERSVSWHDSRFTYVQAQQHKKDTESETLEAMRNRTAHSPCPCASEDSGVPADEHENHFSPVYPVTAPTYVPPYERIRIESSEPHVSDENCAVALKFLHAMELRDRYVWRRANWPPPIPPGFLEHDPRTTRTRTIPAPFQPFDCPIPPTSSFTFAMNEQGVFVVHASEAARAANEAPLHVPPTQQQYYRDLGFVLKLMVDGPSKTFAFHRLELLSSFFKLHLLLNEERELAEMKTVPHRDFYNVRKVDTHVHLASSMNSKHLVTYMKQVLKATPDDPVLSTPDGILTLRQVFEKLSISSYDLSVDVLDMKCDKQTFQRFDRFNLKYNPCGQTELREIFLKTNNFIKGRYLAGLFREVCLNLEASKYCLSEPRVSIYGRYLTEWGALADWVIDNRIYSDNSRFLIQIPRLYDVYKSKGEINNFQDKLFNIFQPLFEVTRDPSANPNLHRFLQQVVGFDCVDDESKPDRLSAQGYPLPKDWDKTWNPPFNYYMFYIYANVLSLNKFREARGFNTFAFRPHCGEAGDCDHLASAFLLSHNVAHGINLRKSPVLQYLFYLKQIGLAMSPLSNNALFLKYKRNPLKEFFDRGLNISLSTDDPLQIHFTREPLVEEYSAAAQVYNLNACDLCEIARNSCKQSGFEHPVKAHWLGINYYKKGVDGNDPSRTNVPNIRLDFRHNTLQQELVCLRNYASGARRA
eukprot:gnl/Spiro4/25393_TR12662_c0_g1_i1.p1 gnl/Spiro4/25393_TR12662_c0_g1~~gnl/Spiro4/25393_TR12662_c0_g1_i1.p1  ORF type:complete len:748 (-),score=211.67 gnl/Spiro4/25393_TR12662_c0_g1_i1:98-2341(-)